MTEQRFFFWQKWLTYANVMALLMGLLAAFFIDSLVFDVYNQNRNAVFFSGKLPGENVQLLIKWLFGIIGATVAGFQLLIIFISENAFKRKEQWAWIAIVSAMCLWMIIDSTLSIACGAWFNFWIINVPSFVLIMIPLMATRDVFLK